MNIILGLLLCILTLLMIVLMFGLGFMAVEMAFDLNIKESKYYKNFRNSLRTKLGIEQ